MKKHVEYNTKGTCSRKVLVDIEDGVITGTMNYLVAGVENA